uniref:NADH-ubiquinone oxidoreductase chain 2 n=1 Tax=Pseudolebinthus lunipterus TaxID=2681891 RepID=A0A650BWK6_9ORTH|nr:NADH dehydrogenase subunit 2 [Pseudolebinthus sp. 1 RN-2019]
MININPSKMLFMMMVIMGTLISIMSNSWPATWIGLEMNLLAFIPLMYTKNNIFSIEASMKYFIIQALASSLLLTTMILHNMTMYMSMNYNMLQMFTSMTLMIKMGAAPFHMWFPMVMEGLSWINCIILMTWQKIAPLTILTYLNLKMMPIYLIILLSVMVGSISGLNQTSMRKIMAYSSINNIGWMLLAMMMSKTLWQFYLIIYSLISITIMFSFMNLSMNSINQLSTSSKTPTMKLTLMMSLLSLGGLPPFLGFLPKWLVIQLSVQQNLTMIILIITMLSLITLFYYIQLSISAFMLNSNQMKWNHNKTIYSSNKIVMLLIISLTSLPLYTLMYINM